jgi:hypothetical protein
VPDASSMPSSTSTPNGPPGADAAGSAPGVEDAAVAVSPPLDADVPDVALDAIVLAPDAATGTEGDPCDLDEDGYKAMGAACGGNDCCDFDGRAYPGEANFYTSADACGSFDYDCNDADEPEYAQANCQLALFQCVGNGFDKAPPACGVTATYDTCNFFVVCYTSQSSVAQGCR